MEKIKKFEREIIFAFVLGVVFSSLLVFWGDLNKTFEQIVSFNWRLIPIVLGLTCFNYFLRFIRWHFFLGKIGFKEGIDLHKSALVFFSGLPLTLTPGKTGEVMKAYFLKKITQDHLSRTIPVVIVERLSDGLAALLLLSFGFFSYSLGWLAMLFALFSCGLFIFLIYCSPFWKFFAKMLSFLGRKRLNFNIINRKLVNFRMVLLKLIGWKNLIIATVFAAVAWFTEAVGLAIIISNIAEVNLTLALISKAVFIFCLVNILGFISLLPGGLGIAEGGFAGMLVLLLNLSRSEAVASTILLRLLTLWWGVAIGMIAFIVFVRYFKFGQNFDEAEKNTV